MMQRVYKPIRRKMSTGLWMGQILTTVAALTFVIPLYVILTYSFKTKKELYLSNPLFLPQTLNWKNYQTAFNKLNLDVTMVNSLLYTAISVLVLAVLCGAAAWAISRGRKRLFKLSYLYL